MTTFEYKNGTYQPKEKIKSTNNKPVYLKEWDCPYCGEHYDSSLQTNKEYTIGTIGPGPWIPHIICPHCKECMGCQSRIWYSANRGIDVWYE